MVLWLLYSNQLNGVRMYMVSCLMIITYPMNCLFPTFDYYKHVKTIKDWVADCV